MRLFDPPFFGAEGVGVGAGSAGGLLGTIGSRLIDPCCEGTGCADGAGCWFGTNGGCDAYDGCAGGPTTGLGGGALGNGLGWSCCGAGVRDMLRAIDAGRFFADEEAYL